MALLNFGKNNKYKSIVEALNNIPGKIELMPGIMAVPVELGKDTIYNIQSRFVIKMVKPTQTIFNEDFRQIMALFNSLNIQINIWDIYNLAMLDGAPDETIRLFELLNDPSNLDNIFKCDNKDNNSSLIYRSEVKLSKIKGSVINIDLFKYPNVSVDDFIDKVLSTDRYTLIAIYLKELLWLVTKIFKERSKCMEIIKNTIKNNKSFKDISDSNLSGICQSLTDMTINFFTNFMLCDTLNNKIDNYNEKSNFDRYKNNPMTEMIREENSESIRNKLGYDYKCNLTIYDFAKIVGMDCIPIEIPSGDDGNNSDDSDETESGNNTGSSMPGKPPSKKKSKPGSSSNKQSNNTNTNNDNNDKQVIGVKIFDKGFIFKSEEHSAEDSISKDRNDNLWTNAADDTIQRLRGFGCTDILSKLGIPIEIETDWTRVILNKIYITYMFMTKKCQSSWSKPNILTRHICSLPTQIHYALDVTLHIAIDSSGSMSDDDLKKINYLITFFNKYNIPMVVYVHDDFDNVKITEINNQKDVDDFIANRYKAGGTSHRGVFSKIEERLSNNRILMKKSIVLVCSDLYSDIDECWQEFEWPKHVTTYFVTPTKNRSVPFGEVVYM